MHCQMQGAQALRVWEQELVCLHPQQWDQVRQFSDGKIKKPLLTGDTKGNPISESQRSSCQLPVKKESYYKRKQREERCRSRAGIEGLISHLKHDHRMKRDEFWF